jgi:hypothetical protein
VRQKSDNLRAMRLCPKCDFHSETEFRRCPQCRANEYLEFRNNVDPEKDFAPCFVCSTKTLLDPTTSWCRRCMRKAGLRLCRACRQPVVVGVSIYAGRAMCISCLTSKSKGSRVTA